MLKLPMSFVAAGALALALGGCASTRPAAPNVAVMPAKGKSYEAFQRDDDYCQAAAQRQVGIVDARGGAATFTGAECFDWAGGVTGDGYAIQGNILAGPEVVEAMHAALIQRAEVIAKLADVAAKREMRA